MASLMGDFDEITNDYNTFVNESEPQFLEGAKTGFINTVLENDELNTLKRFFVSGVVTGKKEYHFSVQIAMLYDSIKTMEFIQQNNNIVDVDYKYGNRKFKKISPREVLSEKITKEDIEGKIVIMGFLGPGNEDKFYTPLNKNPNEPDMYGVEYLANIVAQILEFREN